MELPSERNTASRAYARGLSWAFDYLLLLGLTATLSAVKTSLFLKYGTPEWSAVVHLALPLLLLPVASYIFYQIFGKTPGQHTFGIEWRSLGGFRARRVYDWLFSLTLARAQTAPGTFGRLILVASVLIFSLGSNAFLWMHDLTIRPFSKFEIPLFAPEPQDKKWIALPFFYATGAIPLTLGSEAESAVEFGLPYERGPPDRFIGKITLYWRGLDSRLIYTGPLTLAAPENQAKLSRCFERWMGCTNIRRKLWRTSIGPFFDGFSIIRNEWFRVENAFLPAEERAQGLYLRSRAERGRIREAYFLVGPKMAVQGLLLDRPEREEGETASQTLAQMVGSVRLSDDLAAPRAFINPKLAHLEIGPKSTLAEMIAAEGFLLAKVSIEPKEAESFYHLAGLGITLFRRAKKEGRIELAATSKTIVKSSLQFVKDIEPESKHLREMELFGAEVQ